ncbi:hypothetical protein SORBI_3008G023100 [Sorghum bicolor]|uniref:Uncharacterized protein n=1 Tax=Sorghum bicolor TaxID=4558 RepID=A0A1B6PB25_SORBI|nr:hypothetical protein SORBI_3008G023100 [Sorghum bicolor]
MQCNAGTFLAEQGTGMVVVSAQGYKETVRFYDLHQWAAQMDLNIRWMASCIRRWMFRDQQPVPVIEVEQGLLYMMENEGFRMWDAIRYHSSLVPLVNRADLLLRFHDHLVNVVVCTNLNGYWAVLGMLQVSVQWHAAVNNNIYLAAFYHSSYYNIIDQTPQVQGFHLLRYHRNPSTHGLEQSVPPGCADASTVPPAPLPAAAMPRGFVPRLAAQQGDTPVQPSFVRWQISLMYYAEWPMFMHNLQRGMHMIGELRCLGIQFLFVYPRR